MSGKSNLLEAVTLAGNSALLHQIKSKEGWGDRIAYLKEVISETIIPALGSEDAEDARRAEKELADYIGFVGLAVDDESFGGHYSDINSRKVEIFREIYLLLPKRPIGPGDIKRRLLSVVVDWWFCLTPGEEADAVFSFLTEAAINSEDRDVVALISREVRNDKHKNELNLRSKLEGALNILSRDFLYAKLPTLTSAVTALWQRSLEQGMVIFLSGISRQFEEPPSLAEQISLVEMAKEIVKLGDNARLAIERLNDDSLLHGLQWEIKEVDVHNHVVTIATEFESCDHHDQSFLGVSYESDVLKRVVDLLKKSEGLDIRTLKVSVTFDGKEEIASAL